MANYTEDGRIKIRTYNTQTRNDEAWFYTQTKKYAMDALTPEQRALMDKLSFDPYIPPEQKKEIELDKFLRNYRLHHGDIGSMSIVDQAFYKRTALQMVSNSLDLVVYRKMADAGVTFIGYKIPANYKVAQTFKLDTPEAVAEKMIALEAEAKRMAVRAGRPRLSDEQKAQNKLRKTVASKTEGETYKVNGSERRFGGVKSREEIEALKRSASMGFMENRNSSSRRARR